MNISQYYTQSWLRLNILAHTYPRPVFALGGAEAADGSVPAAEKSPAKAAKAKKQEGLDDGIVQFSLDCNMNQDDTLMNLK